MPRSQPRWVEAMKKPSRAGGKRAKALPRNALKPRGRNAPKPQSNRRSAADQPEPEVAQLKRELHEALEQQTATSEVLQVISSSPGAPQQVFDTMLEKAARVCDANFGNIYRWDGDALHLAATHNTPQAFAEARRRSPLRPDPNLPLGRVIANKTVIHVADARAEEAFARQRHPAFVAAIELGGARTFLFVPMLKEDELIGLFALYRQEVRPFADKQIALVQNFASQAVIAIENARLLNDLRQRTSDLTESLEQQTATANVLRVISSTSTDIQPVLDTIVRTAGELCASEYAALFRLRPLPRGSLEQCRSGVGEVPLGTPDPC